MGNEIPHSAFPNPHSIRVVFPSPDCNPGVRKYWGGDERFDSFATHLFQCGMRNADCGMSLHSEFPIPHSEFQFAPVCCDGIGNLTFNQVSSDARVQFPSGVLFDFG